MSSFDRIDTAARARELIGKIAGKQVQLDVPRPLIGRMMSVDLPRLKGTVWFAGDEQVTPVDIFANAVPADWQHKEPGRVGQDSSTEGFGSEVVVERLNGTLYVTQILTGGSAALDFKTLNMSLLGMRGAQTQAGGPGADAIVDITWRPYETFMNMRIDDDNVPVGAAVEFGPFTTWIETTPFGGMMELSVQLGDTFRQYELAMNIHEDFDIVNENYTQALWARLLPKHEHGARWYPADARAYQSQYSVDVCLRRTAYGNPQFFEGYREMWFRIVKQNEWKNIPGINAAITFRTQTVQRGRSLGGRELFMYEVVNNPSFPVGYVGFHEANMGPTRQISNFSDNFGRTVTGGWGQGDSVYNTDWAPGTAGVFAVNNGVATIDIQANNTAYEIWNFRNSSCQPDVIFRIKCPVVATGASIKAAMVVAHNPSTNDRNLFGLDFKLSGALDVTARRRASGVVSDLSAAVGAGFTYAAGDWINFRVRQWNDHANSQTIWLKAWKDADPEPTAWHKEFTYTNGGGVFYNGYMGFYVSADTSNSNTKSITMSFSKLEGVQTHETWAGHGETWNTGPWRTPQLRLATDLQKTFTYSGSFVWDGTYLKLPTKIHFTGVGRKRDGLASGRAELFMNSQAGDELILHYPYRSTEGGSPYLTVTYSQGIPLAAGESLWCGIEPGAQIDNFFRYLFIVDSMKAWESSIPEWAVLIAARGFSDSAPEIRLGSGEFLDKWRPLSYATNWSDYGSGYSAGAYRMEAGGVVRLRGLIKHTTTGATGVIATLPVGFRPTERKMYTSLSTSAGTVGSSRIDIANDGTINSMGHFTGGGSAFMSIEAYTFPTT